MKKELMVDDKAEAKKKRKPKKVVRKKRNARSIDPKVDLVRK